MGVGNVQFHPPRNERGVATGHVICGLFQSNGRLVLSEAKSATSFVGRGLHIFSSIFQLVEWSDGGSQYYMIYSNNVFILWIKYLKP